MSTVMLKLPMTSVLLATLLLTADGLTVMPLVIVAVVVAYVTAARLEPAPPARHRAPPTVPTATGTPRRSNPAKRHPLPRATTDIGNSGEDGQGLGNPRAPRCGYCTVNSAASPRVA